LNSIDLNADIGEGKGLDNELLKIISSASIACGAHAGDDNIMATTLEAAKRAKVITGAHPGFADKENFGRYQLDIPAKDMGEQVVEQIRRINLIASEIGQNISYLKLHGALYNLAAKDYSYAKTIFAAVKKFNPALAIMALDNSEQTKAASELALKIIPEAFADRAYQANGQLLSRSQEGAVFSDPQQAVNQAISIAKNREITSFDEVKFKSTASSLCLHGDNEAALGLAFAIKAALEKSGIKICARI